MADIVARKALFAAQPLFEPPDLGLFAAEQVNLPSAGVLFPELQAEMTVVSEGSVLPKGKPHAAALDDEAIGVFGEDESVVEQKGEGDDLLSADGQIIAVVEEELHKVDVFPRHDVFRGMVFVFHKSPPEVCRPLPCGKNSVPRSAPLHEGEAPSPPLS